MNKFTSSNVSLAGLEMASLISRAKSCCSAISCIMSSILSMSLKEQNRQEGWKLLNLQKIWTFIYCYLTTEKFWHGFVHVLQGLGSVAHILQDLCVCVRVLQSFPLELNGGECPINLGQLLLEALLPLQGHEGNWLREDAHSIHPDWAGYCQATHSSCSTGFYFWPSTGDSTGSAAPVWRNRLDSQCTTHRADQYSL